MTCALLGEGRASEFCQQGLERLPLCHDEPDDFQLQDAVDSEQRGYWELADRWILSRLNKTLGSHR